MKPRFYPSRGAGRMGGCNPQRGCRRQGESRTHRDPVGALRGARRAGARRLQPGGQDARGQARRARRGGDRRRRRTQAGRRGDQGQGTPRARSGQFRCGSGLLQRAAGDPQAGHRVERVPHLAQRRHLEFRRQAVQPELLRHLLSERSESRGARQICAGQGRTSRSS